MATIGTLTVKLDAVTGPLVRGFRTAQTAAERWTGGVVSLGARVGKVVTNLGRSAADLLSQMGTAGEIAGAGLRCLSNALDGVGTSIAGILTLNPAKIFEGLSGALSSVTGTLTSIASTIAKGVIPQFDAIDRVAKVSDKLGIATHELTAFHHAAELTGVGATKLNTAMQRMVRRIAEVAATGGGTAAKTLETLGLNAERLAAVGPGEALKEIADAMDALPTQGDKIRAAFSLFDTEGVDLVNMLRGGRENLEAMLRDAEQLGLTFDRLGAAEVEKANDALTRLKAAFTGVFRQIAIGIAPLIEPITEKLIPLVQRFGQELVFWIRAAIEDWDVFWNVLKGILTVVEARVKKIAVQMMSLGMADVRPFERLEAAGIDMVRDSTFLLRRLQEDRDAARSTAAAAMEPRMSDVSAAARMSQMREAGLREQFSLAPASGPGLLDARSVEAFRRIAQASQPIARRPVEERQLDVLEDIRDELAGDVTEIDLVGI